MLAALRLLSLTHDITVAQMAHKRIRSPNFRAAPGPSRRLQSINSFCAAKPDHSM
jgi:hypothetical protein